MVSPALAPHPDPGRQRSSGVPTGWFLALVAVIGVLAVAVALQAALLSDSGSEGRDQSAASLTGQATSTPGDPPATAEASAQPSAPAAAKRPADLIVDLRIMVIRLERDGQLGADSADDLDKRLKEAARSLAKGDVRHALESLNGVAERITRLHEVGKLQDASYRALAETMTQLARAMPKP
jgi:hypothetical protein